jgi:trimeric autotransporter adhesin
MQYSLLSYTGFINFLLKYLKSSTNASATIKKTVTSSTTVPAVAIKTEPKTLNSASKSTNVANSKTSSSSSKTCPNPELVDGLRKLLNQHKSEQAAAMASSSSSSKSSTPLTTQPTKITKKTSSTVETVTPSAATASTSSSQTNTPKQSAKSNSTTPLTNSGLSSEMTSLERRLLSMDKNKKSLIASKPLETAAAAATTTTTLTTAAASSSSSNSKNLNAAKMAELEKKKRDEIRKLLREHDKDKSTTTTATGASLKLGIKNESLTPTSAPPTASIATNNTPNGGSNCDAQAKKRKKSFWEPDSDSEYDKIKKIRNSVKGELLNLVLLYLGLCMVKSNLLR